MDFLALICPSVAASEREKLAADAETLSALVARAEPTDAQSEDATLDIVFKIVKKNPFKNLAYVRVLAMAEQTFLLSSSHIVKQNYNLCFHAKGVLFNKADFFFHVGPETRLKVLFLPEQYLIANLRPICSEYIHDAYHTANLRGLFRNNCVEFTELREYNDRNYVPMIKGLVLKKAKLRDCIVLNLLDLRNFIDTFKLYLNFKYVEEIDAFDREVLPNDVITLRDNIRKTITKKLEIAYAAQYHRNAKIDVVRQTKYAFKGFKARKRIERNAKNVEFPLTELVNLQPHVLHRAMVRLVLRPLKVLYAEIKLFCAKCRRKASLCGCAQPQLDQIDFFASLICQNSALSCCAAMKGAESFMAFFEVSHAELDHLIAYLKSDGDVRYTFGSFVSFESKLAGVMTILEKQLGDKIVWGKPVAKLTKLEGEERAFYVNFLRVKNSVVYPNGLIRHNSAKHSVSYVFDLKIKHVEDDPALVTRAKFSALLSKLLL